MNLRISLNDNVFDAFASGMNIISVKVDYADCEKVMKICAGEDEDKIHIYTDNSFKLTLTWETIFMLSKGYARNIPVFSAYTVSEISGAFIESSLTNEIEVF